MKNLFLLCLFVLTAFSQVIQFRNSKNEKDATGAPVLYWATDLNPTRQKTVNLFRAWLKTNHYPDIDLRVDAQNGKLEKLLVQGVSGVGPDIFNLFGWDMQYLYQVGLVANLDPLMKDLPLPSENHDPTVSNDLYVDGKRIAFSQNAGTSYYFVNRTYLRSVGMALPPEKWDLDTFEAYGKEFYQKANRNRTDGLKSFLVNTVDRETLRRSAGVSCFNETLTASGLNRPEHVALLKRLYKWTYEDHVIPSAAEGTMFTMDQGRGSGNYTQLFHRGYMPLFWSGLPIFILLRDISPTVEIGIAEAPTVSFRNSVTRTFATALYPGKRNMHLARYFLLYLTTETHNLEIAENGDQMPPIPSFRVRDVFMKPAAWPNEWDAHRIYSQKALEIGIPSEYSPYVAYSPYQKEERDAVGAHTAGIITAEEACARMEKNINHLIRRNVANSAELKSRYDKALANQQKIDALKKEGKKIPLDLVENPFLHRYYRDTGKGI